jgi:hypothetical protein
VHVFQMFPFLEASRKAFSSFRLFVRTILPLNQIMEPVYLDPSIERVLNAEMRNTRSTLVSGVGEPELYDTLIYTRNSAGTSNSLVAHRLTSHSSELNYGRSSPMSEAALVRMCKSYPENY